MAARAVAAMAVVAAGRATCTESHALTRCGEGTEQRLADRQRRAAVRGAIEQAHPLRYLSHYAPELQKRVRTLLDSGQMPDHLRGRYPSAHAIRDDRALFNHVARLRSQFLRKHDSLNKVVFDSKIHVVRHALGLHTTISRAQGGKLKARHEIRIASFFKQVPGAFLQMIVVHELAHLREKVHDKAFYQLCCHMEPDYHQYEFDVRLYLTWCEMSGELLW